MLEAPVKKKYRRISIDKFGGFDMREGQKLGKLYTHNLSSDRLPKLSARGKRYVAEHRYMPMVANGIGAGEKIYRSVGTKFYYDNDCKGDLPAGASIKRKYLNFGKYVIILPDKMYYNTENNTYGSLESIVTCSLSGAEFCAGTLNGTDAGINTINYRDVIWAIYGLKVGDALTVRYKMSENGTEKSITATVREITVGEMRFDAGTFEGLTTATITFIGRVMPELDCICACDNRIWGCNGNKIYCSAPADPFNWYGDNCWSEEIIKDGQFTGCFAYNGSPLFFKENSIWRIYGNRPGNYQPSAEYSSYGVMNGCADTLAAMDGKIYYLSRHGVVRYESSPEIISHELDGLDLTGGIGVSDGRKYYLGTVSGLFVFDTFNESWMREEGLNMTSAVYYDGRLYAECGYDIIVIGNVKEPETAWDPEGSVESYAEWRDIDLTDRSNGKITLLTVQYPTGGDGIVSASFDGGDWVRAYGSNGKYSINVPSEKYNRCTLRAVVNSSIDRVIVTCEKE